MHRRLLRGLLATALLLAAAAGAPAQNLERGKEINAV